MEVNSLEFRTHLSDYIEKLAEEDVYITRHGKTVGVLTSPTRREAQIAEKTTLERYLCLIEEHLAEMLTFMKSNKSGG